MFTQTEPQKDDVVHFWPDFVAENPDCLGGVNAVIGAIDEVDHRNGHQVQLLGLYEERQSQRKHNQNDVDYRRQQSERKSIEKHTEKQSTQAVENGTAATHCGQEAIIVDFGVAVLFVVEGDEHAKRY
jgi:hypothetical protein